MYRLTPRQSAAFLVASTNPSIDGESLLVHVVQGRDPDDACGRTRFLEHLAGSGVDWPSAAAEFDGECEVPTSARLTDGSLKVFPGKDSRRVIGKRSSDSVDGVLPALLKGAGDALWVAGNSGAPLSFAQLLHGLPEYSERFAVVVVRVL